MSVICSICLCNLCQKPNEGGAPPAKKKKAAEGAVAVVTKCGHGFHISCLQTWLHGKLEKGVRKPNTACPKCRKMVRFSETRELFLDQDEGQCSFTSTATPTKGPASKNDAEVDTELKLKLLQSDYSDLQMKYAKLQLSIELIGLRNPKQESEEEGEEEDFEDDADDEFFSGDDEDDPY